MSKTHIYLKQNTIRQRLRKQNLTLIDITKDSLKKIRNFQDQHSMQQEVNKLFRTRAPFLDSCSWKCRSCVWQIVHHTDQLGFYTFLQQKPLNIQKHLLL